MIRVTIRRQARPGDPWQTLGEGLGELPPADAAEGDWLALRFDTDERPALRVFVGDVLVASTLHADRVAAIEPGEDEALACRGRFLADWAGLTEVVVQVRDADDWTTLVTLPLAVAAGKLTAEEFEQLFRELERSAAVVLLDLYGKTRVGLREAPAAPLSPVAQLRRVRETIEQLGQLLPQIARRPASRLRVQVSREPALPGQAISETTLAEACLDPGLLGRRGSQVAFREHLRERGRPDYHLSEHQLIADFLVYLDAQLGGLRQRLEAEVIERRERKRWRDRKETDRPSWWESEDLPRLEELGRCLAEVAGTRERIRRWATLPFLPPGRVLSEPPQSTPLFRHHGPYRRLFRVMAAHFRQYQATLDTHHLLTQVRSLPVLYEWWCAVGVLSALTRGLIPLGHDPTGPPLMRSESGSGGKRFLLEFAAGQSLMFSDGRGARVRFVYQPPYTVGSFGADIGLLDESRLRTPDLALEVYPARQTGPAVPDLIVILDAKYSSLPQRDKLVEVASKYGRLGDRRTGRVISRQVWALTPAAPEGWRPEGLRGFCTVDNVGFWSEQFSSEYPVNGAVQARPLTPGAFNPVAALVATILKRAGVSYGEAVAT